MSDFPKLRLNLTRNLRTPNYYTRALDGEFADFAFNEERAPFNKSKWRSEVFKVPPGASLDVEIGTGNGTHFCHHALAHPKRCLVGLEIKYKPLIQTIRRTLKGGAKNAAVVRSHAFTIDQLFEKDEIDDVFIHFPDPWTSPRKPKNRVVQKRNLDILWDLQRPGAKIDFKTDSEEAFKWCLEEIRQTKYKMEFLTHNLHKSEMLESNFVTAFEKIFLREGLPIHFIRLRKT
jgi:tRNA (guanine-N7-)-methyltransferase